MIARIIVLRGAREGDTVCGIKLTRHDIEAFQRILRVFDKVTTMDHARLMLVQNTRALSWLDRLERMQ